MKKYNIIIAGSRDFCDYNLMKKTLDDFINSQKVNKANITIISGAASGADNLGERYAIENDIALMRCPADWKKYGRAAGPKRNEYMAQLAQANGECGVLFAFWDGTSRGTKSMISLAEKNGLSVYIINFNL